MEIEKRNKAIVEDYKTMTLTDLEVKYNLGRSQICLIVKGKVCKYTIQKKENIKRNSEICKDSKVLSIDNLVKKYNLKKHTIHKIIRQGGLFVKRGKYKAKETPSPISQVIKKNKRVFETVTRDPSAFRRVNMLDNKNTVKEILLSDTRTDAEIREEFRNEQYLKLKKLLS